MSEKTRADLQAWRALASADLNGREPDELVCETPDGIRIKPLYTAADLEDLERLAIVSLRGDPGEEPGRGSEFRLANTHRRLVTYIKSKYRAEDKKNRQDGY